MLHIHQPVGWQVATRAMTEAGDEEYNDLDELIARYAEPYMRNVEAVTKHRCACCARVA